jgi:hypothetical protein
MEEDRDRLIATGLFGQYRIARSDGGFTITLMSGGNTTHIGQSSTVEFAKDTARALP